MHQLSHYYLDQNVQIFYHNFAYHSLVLSMDYLIHHPYSIAFIVTVAASPVTADATVASSSVIASVAISFDSVLPIVLPSCLNLESNLRFRQAD